MTGLVLFSIAVVFELTAIITWLAMYDSKRPLYVFYFVISLFIQNFGSWIGKWLSYSEVRLSFC